VNSEAQKKSRAHFWRRLRVNFRRFRITVLLVILVIVCVGGYLNHFGLPDFAKRPLLQSLHEHGIDLEFSRLRLRWYRGLVAEDVRLQRAGKSSLPAFTAQSAEVKLDYRALTKFKLDVLGVTLRQGNLRWKPEAADLASDIPPIEIAISNITANLRFLPGDEWSLDNFRAEYLGARFSINGRITHATSIRQWPLFRGGERQQPSVVAERLQRLHTQLAKIRFVRRPDFHLALAGDGADPRSFTAQFSIVADDAATPWGKFRTGRLNLELTPSTTNTPVGLVLTVAAAQLKTRWVELRNLDLEINAGLEGTNAAQCRLALRGTGFKSDDIGSDSFELGAEWLQKLDLSIPPQGAVELRLGGVTLAGARVGAVMVKGRFDPATTPMATNPALGAWAGALPYDVSVDCAATNANIGTLHLDSLNAIALWRPPFLTLTNLKANLPSGGIGLNVGLDVSTRRLNFEAAAQFDFHLLAALLTPKSSEWIEKFSWEGPPALQMTGGLTLPPWTNRQPDWRGEVQPAVVLDGAVQLTNASYLGIGAQTAASHFNYSNRVWRLTDLALTRPEGTLRLELQSDEISHDYAIRLRGPFDFRALGPLFDEKAEHVLSLFEFSGAPDLEADVHGRWSQPELFGARGQVKWTNFSFRAQHADRLEVSLEYTNQIMEVFNPRIERGAERGSADYLRFNFASNLAWLTNGWTDIDPMVIASAIGPKVALAVAPYRFLKPPVARVSGVIPLHGERDANLHFDLDGGPFAWMKFTLPHVAGHICWANESVTLSNITASFYGGDAQGSAWFDVRPGGGTPFRFDVGVSNASLHALMADLTTPTNRLEGVFSAQLSISSANTDDWTSWNGSGSATLRDGLIWDSPVFGVMSSVMNAFVPGIGNSRASEANGTFAITNSVIYTSDLDIRASGMLLEYEGTVDFQTQVNSRVRAELLRNTWFIGPVVSTALWPVSKLFEYKVTGTLADPKLEPVYLVPKIFLAPLHPIKSIKEIFPPSAASTNAPPEP
jgi:hypothetical protein